MAVSGLPQPNKGHALAAARFAFGRLLTIRDITKELEIQLGPGTAGLGLRVGLHSGTVTGGVLRGGKAQFQLFGDTVNTAARMESLGVPGKVQVSQATTDLITADGKEHWLARRKEPVTAKGKGEMQVCRQVFRLHNRIKTSSFPIYIKQTYFVKQRLRRALGQIDNHSIPIDLSNVPIPAVDCGVTEAYGCLSHELALILDGFEEDWGNASHNTCSHPGSIDCLIEWSTEPLLQCLIGDIEPMGRYTRPAGDDKASVSYRSVIRSQLNALIADLSSLFPELPYHNFEHSSIVAMFANKLMKQGVERLQSSNFADSKQNQSYADAHVAVVFSVLVTDIRYRHDTSGNYGSIVALVLDLVRTENTILFALPFRRRRRQEAHLRELLQSA